MCTPNSDYKNFIVILGKLVDKIYPGCICLHSGWIAYTTYPILNGASLTMSRIKSKFLISLWIG